MLKNSVFKFSYEDLDILWNKKIELGKLSIEFNSHAIETDNPAIILKDKDNNIFPVAFFSDNEIIVYKEFKILEPYVIRLCEGAVSYAQSIRTNRYELVKNAIEEYMKETIL